MNVTMDTLPDDIIEIIINNLTSYRDLYSVICLNKNFYKMYIDQYSNCIGNLRYIIQDYPIYICDLFDCKYDLAELPIYNYTRYDAFKYNSNIEQIFPDEMSHSIMRGADIYGRKYICFKVFFKFRDPQCSVIDVDDCVVITLHETYSCCYSPHGAWTFSSMYNISSYIHRGCLPTYTVLQDYRKMIIGESITVDKYIISLYK